MSAGVKSSPEKTESSTNVQPPKDTGWNLSSRVEQLALEKSGYELIHTPTEKIPSIIV